MVGIYSSRKLEKYEEFVSSIDDLGFFPMSSNRIEFPSLEGMTEKRNWYSERENDPWVWKNRIVDEKKAVYGKFFDRKPGFISLKMFPYFLAVRRKGDTFDMMYLKGQISHDAKTIYELFKCGCILPTHEIKTKANFGRENKAKYESAITDLQMNMFLVVCGMVNIIGKNGEAHSWPATAYTAVESWLPRNLLDESRRISPREAENAIMERVFEILPDADEVKARKLTVFNV